MHTETIVAINCDHQDVCIALQAIFQPRSHSDGASLFSPASFRICTLPQLRIDDPFRHVEISLKGVAKSEIDRYIRTHPELSNIMSQLANVGIRIDVLQPNSPTEVFVAELPNGKQYLFSRAGLLKLRDEGQLNIPGIETSGVTR